MLVAALEGCSPVKVLQPAATAVDQPAAAVAAEPAGAAVVAAVASAEGRPLEVLHLLPRLLQRPLLKLPLGPLSVPLRLCSVLPPRPVVMAPVSLHRLQHSPVPAPV
jgi:hypothetical protein